MTVPPLLCPPLPGVLAVLVAALGPFASTPLVATVVGSLALGVLYSTELPFMRWKRSPTLAAGCILAVSALGCAEVCWAEGEEGGLG